MKACLTLVVLLAFVFVQPATAQTPPTVNPDSVEFTPSPNHGDLLTSTGGVTKYTLKVMAMAAPTVVLKTVDLGKPAPGATGKITVSNLKQYFVSLPDGSYAGLVEAEGPGGVTPSVMSDPFTVARMQAPAAPGKPAWKGATASSRTPPASALKRKTGSS